MATQSIDDQLKFALACHRYSNPGKIDWKAVAKDCNIVTPGAAQKRWERLNKANGISATRSSNADDGGDPSTPEPKEKGKAQAGGRESGRTSAKKRRLQQGDEEQYQEEHGTMKQDTLLDEDKQDAAFIKNEV